MFCDCFCIESVTDSAGILRGLKSILSIIFLLYLVDLVTFLCACFQVPLIGLTFAVFRMTALK